MNKKRSFAWLAGHIVTILVAMFLFAMPQNSVYAEELNTDEQISVTFDVEKFSIGQGYLIRPKTATVPAGTNVAELLVAQMDEAGYCCDYNGSLTDSFYLSMIKNADNGKTKIPSCIRKLPQDSSDIWAVNDALPDLGEFCYSNQSGWIFTVNNIRANVAASDYILQNGDVVRWQYTVYGCGDDVAPFGSNGVYSAADKDTLTKLIARYREGYGAKTTSASAKAYYSDALKIAVKINATQEETDTAVTWMKKAISLAKKKDQTITVKIASKVYYAKKLKKAKASFKLGTKVLGGAKVTYKDSSKYITVSKYGKVTIKKGIKKGTYKIKISAAATKNYNKAYKYVKLIVK